MLAALLRLFALRPILAGSLLGIPILTLILLGIFAALFLKLLLFVILPIVAVVWLVKRLRREPIRTM
jgi:type IV secretory pathway VirB3-like protein